MAIKLLHLVLAVLLAAVVLATQQTTQEDERRMGILFPVGINYKYKYHSNIQSFGGDSQESKKDGENSKIVADVNLTCVKQWKQENGKMLYLLLARFSNVVANMKVASEENWKDVSVKSMPIEEVLDTKSLDDAFAGFTAFTLSSNGKIYKVYYEKEAPEMVIMAKKSILQHFQVKVSSAKARIEEGAGIGDFVAHYNQQVQEDNSVLIRKEFTDRDLIEDVEDINGANAGAQDIDNMDEHRQEMKLKSTMDVHVQADGQVLSSKKRDEVELGTHTKYEPTIFSERNVPYEENLSWSTGNSMWLNIEENSELALVEKTEVDTKEIEEEELAKYLSELINENEDLADKPLPEDFHPTFKVHPSIVESKGLKVHGLKKVAKEMRKQRLVHKHDFKKLLKQLRSDPYNAPIASAVREFVELDDGALHSVHALFKQLANKYDSHHVKSTNLLRLLQSVILSNKSAKAQKLFLSTFIDQSLTRHGILRTLDIPKPVPEVVKKLKKYAKSLFTNATASVADVPETDLNAYLALAEAIRKTSSTNKDQAQSIMKEMVSNLISKLTHSSNTTTEGSVNPADIIFHLNALGNAGSLAPLSLLKDFIIHPKVTGDVKQIAIHALRKRTDKAEDEQVSQIIQTVIDSKDFDDLLKSTAISSQIAREPKVKSKRLALPFIQMIKKRQEEEQPADKAYAPVSSQLSKLVLDYLYKCDAELMNSLLSKRAEQKKKQASGNSTADASIEELLSDSEFFNTIEKAFDKAAGAVVGASKAAAGAVVDAAKDVGKAVDGAIDKVGNVFKGTAEDAKRAFNNIASAFKEATFVDNKVCFRASADPNDYICMFDRQLAEFTKNMGDLSTITKKTHFVFEKLIGANKVHTYVGALGYLGSNFQCGAKDFTSQLVGKGIVRAQVFSSTYNLIDAVVMMSKTAQSYNDLVYVSIMGNVMVNAKILERDMFCKNIEKKLFEKDFPALPSQSFTIMIGPVPVAFSFSVHVKLQVNALVNFCLPELTLGAGLKPSVDIHVSGAGMLTAFVAKAGVELTVSNNYALIPNIAAQGAKCQLCAKLDYSTRPMAVTITAFADVNLLVFKTHKEKELFHWQAAPATGTYYQKCVSIQ